MLPPDTTPLTLAIDREHAELVRDAAAYRLIGDAGWVLIRRRDLEELETFLADLLAQCRANAKEVMKAQSPATPNEATAERR